MSRHVITIHVEAESPFDPNKTQTLLAGALWSAKAVAVVDVKVEEDSTHICDCGAIIKSSANGNRCRLCARK